MAMSEFEHYLSRFGGDGAGSFDSQINPSSAYRRWSSSFRNTGAPSQRGATSARPPAPIKNPEIYAPRDPDEETNDAGLPADGSHGSNLNSAKFPADLGADDPEMQHYNKVIANQTGDSIFSAFTRDDNVMDRNLARRDHRISMLKQDYIEQHPELFRPAQKDDYHNAPVDAVVWRNGKMIREGTPKDPKSDYKAERGESGAMESVNTKTAITAPTRDPRIGSLQESNIFQNPNGPHMDPEAYQGPSMPAGSAPDVPGHVFTPYDKPTKPEVIHGAPGSTLYERDKKGNLVPKVHVKDREEKTKFDFDKDGNRVQLIKQDDGGYKAIPVEGAGKPQKKDPLAEALAKRNKPASDDTKKAGDAPKKKKKDLIWDEKTQTAYPAP